MCSLYIYVQVCLDVFEPISLFVLFPFDTSLILETLFNTMAAARNYALRSLCCCAVVFFPNEEFTTCKVLQDAGKRHGHF